MKASFPINPLCTLNRPRWLLLLLLLVLQLALLLPKFAWLDILGVSNGWEWPLWVPLCFHFLLQSSPLLTKLIFSALRISDKNNTRRSGSWEPPLLWQWWVRRAVSWKAIPKWTSTWSRFLLVIRVEISTWVGIFGESVILTLADNFRTFRHVLSQAYCYSPANAPADEKLPVHINWHGSGFSE